MNVQPERISQLLPSVKCSDCGESVEFRRLGEHFCQAAPAVPALPSAYKKSPIKNPSPSSRPVDDTPSIPKPNLNPLSVPDSGYSGYSGSKYTSPPSSTSSPKGPTSFLQKYEQMTGKQVTPSSQSPRNSPMTSPIDNNSISKRLDRPQDNFNSGSDYMYDNRRDPYGQGYSLDRGRNPPNNDRYNQPPFDENNNRYMDDTYRMDKPRVPFQKQNDRDTREEIRNRNKSPASYDRSNNNYGNKFPPSNYDSRQPTYDKQNGQSPYNYDNSRMPLRNSPQERNGPQPPFSKPYMPPSPQGRYDQRNNTDPYDGRRVDDLMNDLMKEMDNMQIPKYNEYDDLRNNSYDVCAYCKNEITHSSNVMWALGKAWHSNHLLCAHCRKPIDPNVGHVEKDGKVFCPKDFANLFLPKCRRCDLPVEKEAVSASDGKLEGKWHVKCFGCHTCYKPFPDKSFYVFDNAPYCRRHYHKLNNSLCRTCDEPIEGPCVQTVEGWRYHPGCFVCINCQIPLTDIYYSFENRQYCETHIEEIKRSRKIRAEKRQTMFRNI